MAFLTMKDPESLPNITCRCLNVRLWYKRTENNPPASSDNNFEPRFVGDDGIKVEHNHLTLRIRSPIPKASTPAERAVVVVQWTSLTCLVCRVVVYRVFHEVIQEAAPKEGPVWPTEEWAESDTLKSKSGWVEVHVGSTGCISGDDIANAYKKSTFSAHYSVLLPESASIPEVSYTPPSASETQPALPAYTLKLPALFPPPPFTPSHPTFMLLAASATASSGSLRSAAEIRISEFIQQQTEEVEAADRELRRHVTLLWRSFREGIDQVRQERQSSAPAETNGTSRSETPRSTSSRSSSRLAVGSPLVREFVPTIIPRVRSPVASMRNGTSGLSASLASSGFYHPQALDEYEQNGNLSPSSSQTLQSSAAGALLSPPLSPTTSVSPTLGGSVSIPVAFRRNMDESVDAAATFQYYTLEASAARINGAQGQASTAPAAGLHTQADPPSVRNGKPKDASPRRQTTAKNGKTDDRHTSEGPVTSPNSKDKKSRRKVTFDMQPDVVTIKREIVAEQAGKRTRTGRDDEMIFNLEESDEERVDAGEEGDRTPIEEVKLPLKEPVEEPRLIPRSKRRVNGMDSPYSFAALRPASLPTPSYIRPPLAQQESPRPEIRLHAAPRDRKGKGRATDVRRGSLSPPAEGSSSWQAHEAEILKLVAAETPSHRSAWKKDSEAWKIFGRRQSDRNRLGKDSPTIAEEAEDQEEGEDRGRGGQSNGLLEEEESSSWRRYQSPNIACSLPISIGLLSKPTLQEHYLSLTIQAPIAERAEAVVSPPPVLEEKEDKKFSMASRKAVYAQRDRKRSMDPGALDFIVDEEEEEEEPTMADVNTEVSVSRRNALEILKIRSEETPSGMWRSLAND